VCGIAGFAGWQPEEREQTLRLMCNAIRHRGPDEEGLGWDATMALGMRRLSIIDVSGGSQPVANEDGSVRVVFNGEIYNFQEIRQRLQTQGHVFRTRSDTEILVHLYEERGPALVHDLRGMFAFALWDEKRQRLLLARDRVGKKPLFYRELVDGVAFASELKSLAAAGLVDEWPDPAAVARFLALGYIPDPFTIYPSIWKLPPAHTLTWSRAEGVKLHRYWEPPASPDPTIDEQTAVEETRRLLEESVRYRLISDVPLGAFLSGGIDSAAVVAEMVRQSGSAVNTYTIGFPDPSFNEAPAAAESARLLGTNHTELIVEPDIDELFETVVCAFDEPFADSSAIPTFLVSRLAARDVKVVLSGDGGDELFGGYSRYSDYARRAVQIPGGMRDGLRLAAHLLPHGAYGRGRLLELAASAIGRYTGMVAHPLALADGGVASAAVSQELEWNELLADGFAQAARRDAIGQLMHVDLLTYLPGDILTKVDRMSMACSLEARSPLLDHHLVEFAMSIPTELRIRGSARKIALREAVRDLLPAPIFNRPKSGFSLPLAGWLRDRLGHRLDALTASSSSIAAYVDAGAVGRLVREHRVGRRDHSAMLWKLIVLEIWCTRVHGENSGSAGRSSRLVPA
jgi:asparagine synthase (glutamine-hydrolysing)